MSGQIGGDHYEQMAIQPWDALRAWLTPEQLIGYHLGEALVYLARFNAAAPGKGGRDDLRKAIHNLERLLEVMPRAATDARP